MITEPIKVQPKILISLSKTWRVLIQIEAELIRLKPDLVVVYGDTNSTLAGCYKHSELKGTSHRLAPAGDALSRCLKQTVSAQFKSALSNYQLED